MKRILSATFGAACLLHTAAVHAVELWNDDFGQTRAYEQIGTRCWTFADSTLRFEATQPPGWLVTTLDDLGQGTLRADITVKERAPGGYVLAGLGLFADDNNAWQLLLVAGPDGRHYCELLERLQGTHQAQLGGGPPGSQLAGEMGGELDGWEFGAVYRLELSFSPEVITGTVTDPRTGKAWHRSYTLAGARAVTQGRPALTAAGLAGEFHRLTVEALEAPRETQWQVPSGPSGTVVLVADADGALARGWQEAFEGAGYGVLVVPWDDLLRGSLPAPETTLLVLADARRVPLQARDAVERALRRRGKVIALGAPAFSELLAHTPAGWVGAEGYHEELIRQLDPVPLEIAEESWERGARFPEKDSSIVPDPEMGAGAWILNVDYSGWEKGSHSWDGFRTSVAGNLADTSDLLVFRARGDGKTSQLLVDCQETDGSRWIATVPLTETWRAYALAPRDFPYWSDSNPARGQGGDRLNLRQVASITFGLATSHTKEVEPGPHRVWLRDVATAADPSDIERDFAPPEIEALSPSYKLFPLPEPLSFRPAAEQHLVTIGTDLLAGQDAFSPVWRERGRGWNRQRSWRWIPLLEKRDAQNQRRGALLSLTVGDAASPDAMWLNLGLADPALALSMPSLKAAVLAAAGGMTRGCFLLEAGVPLFSCVPGEEMALGAEIVNAGITERNLTVEFSCELRPGTGAPGQWAERQAATVAAGARTEIARTWQAPTTPGTYTLTTTLLGGPNGTEPWDRITQDIVVVTRDDPAADDFVSVEGSQFMLHGKPWSFKGVNYRPTWVGGYPHLNLFNRECYDPEIVERDLSWMEEVGINAISAIFAIQATGAGAAEVFRDQIDFLDRCERHGVKVFLFMPNARPFADVNADRVIDYIERAGIKDHPAIMCWELAWEPIHGAWGNPNGLLFFQDPWNAWVRQRYGSIESAVADWGFSPGLGPDGNLPVPTSEMCTTRGAWDPLVAAFRRAWSDVFSQAYRDIVTRLRAYDPRHLISFRFGACSIPSGQAFAHSHSIGVLKHVDFMNPEGYSLSRGWCIPTPADDLRKGGLITLYFRHFSNEKPVVWMEFGYTVNGMVDPWTQDRIHIDPREIAFQKTEYEGLFAMFLESGARGAAAWWMPGGFRLGENSDFGIVDPDGTERPACKVMLENLPKFDHVRHEPPTAFIDLDLDTHAADGWQVYSEAYLRLVKAGQRPHVRTAGTGTDSANCPLIAVGGRPYTGHNPPIFLNAEFNSLEVRSGEGAWQAVTDGAVVRVKTDAPVMCRASVGNLAEATWRLPVAGQTGGVYLTGRRDYGLEFAAPIEAETPFLGDAQVVEFVLIPQAQGETMVSFEMQARDRAWFGERRTVKIIAEP